MNDDAALRAIPSVERVLHQLGARSLPRPVMVDVVRQTLDVARQQAIAGQPQSDPVATVKEVVERLGRSRLRPVINGAGVIIHTNFGRSPMGPRVATAVEQAARSYCNLEFDLGSGQRGGRGAYLERLLARLCEAPAATVVNNCAAGLVLILRTLITDSRREVIISRGELVQIGGGFRIPDILQTSGAVIREVGTTNRTSIDDYRQALCGATAMILKVHQSNFYMGGFVESASLRELAEVAREASLPLVEDLGSGAVFDTLSLGGGEAEPTPAQCLAAGASVVCFSGDKLLGGPQAGIIAGDTSLVARLKRDPFFRALRCDKLVMAALQATAEIHLDPASRAVELPVFAAMQEPHQRLRERASRLVEQIDSGVVSARVVDAETQVGGGSLPKTRIPSAAIELSPRGGPSVETLARRLRLGEPPVIGYIHANRLRLDLRTIFADQEQDLLRAIHEAASALRP